MTECPSLFGLQLGPKRVVPFCKIERAVATVLRVHTASDGNFMLRTPDKPSAAANPDGAVDVLGAALEAAAHAEVSAASAAVEKEEPAEEKASAYDNSEWLDAAGEAALADVITKVTAALCLNSNSAAAAVSIEATKQTPVVAPRTSLPSVKTVAFAPVAAPQRPSTTLAPALVELATLKERAMRGLRPTDGALHCSVHCDADVVRFSVGGPMRSGAGSVEGWWAGSAAGAHRRSQTTVTMVASRKGGFTWREMWDVAVGDSAAARGAAAHIAKLKAVDGGSSGMRHLLG
eukprot:SAG11_NODE_1319_length_5209_cov_10.314873_5_plen_290_part_00